MSGGLFFTPEDVFGQAEASPSNRPLFSADDPKPDVAGPTASGVLDWEWPAGKDFSGRLLSNTFSGHGPAGDGQVTRETTPITSLPTQAGEPYAARALSVSPAGQTDTPDTAQSEKPRGREIGGRDNDDTGGTSSLLQPPKQREGRPLVDYEKQALIGAGMVNTDVDNAKIVVGLPPLVGLDNSVRAVTIGNTIYVNPKVQIDNTSEWLALLGHEVAHVGQYRMGMTLRGYLLESLARGYVKNQFEIAPMSYEDFLLDYFKRLRAGDVGK